MHHPAVEPTRLDHLEEIHLEEIHLGIHQLVELEPNHPDHLEEIRLGSHQPVELEPGHLALVELAQAK